MSVSAAMMARYDFGDNIMKSAGARESVPGPRLQLESPAVRYAQALTRMVSSPAGDQPDLHLLLGSLAQQSAVAAPHRRLERTQSAPAPAVAASQNPSSATVNTSRYKTELCRPYEEFGVCKYGDKCQFAHGGAELRSLARHPKYKTELCRTYHTVGFCPYGPRCHFVHNQDEVQGQKCGLRAHNGHVQVATVAAVAAAAQVPRQRPSALSPTLSLDSASPPCSLSQSPTSSMGSFFSSEPELHSPGGGAGSPADDQRLPVFNRLSAVQVLTISDLVI